MGLYEYQEALREASLDVTRQEAAERRRPYEEREHRRSVEAREKIEAENAALEAQRLAGVETASVANLIAYAFGECPDGTALKNALLASAPDNYALGEAQRVLEYRRDPYLRNNWPPSMRRAVDILWETYEQKIKHR